jgi:hypothetical protein
VGIYIKLYPEYTSKNKLEYDSTTSSNRNWDLTHKISESTEKSETDKIKSAPRKFYERLMQKHEPVRPQSRHRDKYGPTKENVIVDLYPTKTLDDNHGLNTSLVTDKNIILSNNLKYTKLGIVKHNNNHPSNNHSNAHNTTGNSVN